MSNGLKTSALPQIIQDGIKTAFDEWMEMSGEWLNTAPEYLVSVHIAQRIRKEIEPTKRTIFLERSVSKTLEKASAIQRGPNAAKLRASGRYDIVVGHKDGRPRAVIEVKSPMVHPLQKSMIKDLNRLCRTLLQNKSGNQIHSGLMAIYAPSKTPTRKDNTARARLDRKWKIELPTKIKACFWAKGSKNYYLTHLNFNVYATLHDHAVGTEEYAWGAVCIEVTRKTKTEIRKLEVNSSTRVRRLGTVATSSDV